MSSTTFRAVRLALMLLAGLALMPAAAAETITLRYGQAYSAAESIYALPIFVADREGFFAREGVRVGSVLIPGGGEKMIAALADGTVDITHVATAFLIQAALAGADAVAIAAEFDNPIYSLVAKPDITSFSDLRGRVVGLADPAGSVAFATRKLLALHGIGDGDISVKLVSGTPARLACLERGACDAVPLGQPQDFAAISAGYRLLGRTNDALPAFLYTVTAVRRSWAKTHGDALVRYVRALAASFRFIRDARQRDAVVRIIVETTGASTVAAQQTLALYLEPGRSVLPRRGEIDLAGLREVIAFMSEARIIKPPLPLPQPERFVDLHYLRAAAAP